MLPGIDEFILPNIDRNKIVYVPDTGQLLPVWHLKYSGLEPYWQINNEAFCRLYGIPPQADGGQAFDKAVGK